MTLKTTKLNSSSLDLTGLSNFTKKAQTPNGHKGSSEAAPTFENSEVSAAAASMEGAVERAAAGQLFTLFLTLSLLSFICLQTCIRFCFRLKLRGGSMIQRKQEHNQEAAR